MPTPDETRAIRALLHGMTSKGWKNARDRALAIIEGKAEVGGE